MVDQLFNSSEKRLACALLLLANFGTEGKQQPVIAKVSQETRADMIGTTRLGGPGLNSAKVNLQVNLMVAR